MQNKTFLKALPFFRSAVRIKVVPKAKLVVYFQRGKFSKVISYENVPIFRGKWQESYSRLL